MDLDDRVTIATPEGVEIALELAGLGSRFIAGAADLIIQLIAILILAVVTGELGGSGGLLVAVFVVLTFGIWFFYNVAFEVLAAGRTPGKMLSHLRVVRESGAPIDLTASAVRNLMRLIDGLTLLYLPTVFSIAISARNQRPGDMAAGTLVIREPARRRRGGERAGVVAGAGSGGAVAGAGSAGDSWDVSAVTAQELAAVRRFLERRETLERRARRELGLRLAHGLRPKVTGAPDGIDPEAFLAGLVRAKGSRG